MTCHDIPMTSIILSYPMTNPFYNCVKPSEIRTMSVEVGQSPVLKAIRYAVTADSLLTHTGDHLRDVDEGT